MSEFKTIAQLNNAFMSGSFKMDESVILDDVTYTLFEAAPVSIVENVRGKHPMVVYLNEQSGMLLVFSWHANSRNALQPAGVALVEDQKVVTQEEQLIVEVDGNKITIRPEQLIGDLVQVQFTGLSSPKELQGKVDTGATVCSLHTDSYQINGTNISFKCGPLSDNLITLPLKAKHAVKSPDGGTVYRPVIELDVKINGKLLSGVEFNLNDRSHMDQPVLVGQNALQAGKFFIDPNIRESVSKIDWAYLQEVANITPMLNRDANEEILAQFYKYMLESDVTFRDLVHHIKRQVIQTFEDIE